jgi:hypothetical protein
VRRRRAATQRRSSTTLLLLALRDESGAPYEGTWRVDWYHLRSAPGASSGTTHGSGTFVQIEVREPGPYSVNVRAPGDAHTSDRVERLAATEVVAARFEASEPPVPITLHPTGWLTGSVVDSYGAPLEGIEVWFERLDQPGRLDFPKETSDESGRFAFDLGAARAGQIRVGDLLHPWVPPIAFRALPANRQIELETIRLELFAATFVVQGADRSALAGARIEARASRAGASRRRRMRTDAHGSSTCRVVAGASWRSTPSTDERTARSRSRSRRTSPVILSLPK